MKKNKMITSRDEDFAKWYTDIVTNAHLATYSGVKGFVILEPNGYAIWESIQEILDKKFKDLGQINYLTNVSKMYENVRQTSWSSIALIRL